MSSKRDGDGIPRRPSDLVSSARSGSVSPSVRAAGVISLTGERVLEEVARETLTRLFGRAGYQIQQDYDLHAGAISIRLDGFDPVAKVGYQFVSHGDADVVTDFDATSELALRDLDQGGRIRVFVVHDTDARTLDELVAVAQEFLLGLDRTQPG